eukprot:364751-Chlamydomonas_euryale.AAC.1
MHHRTRTLRLLPVECVAAAPHRQQLQQLRLQRLGFAHKLGVLLPQQAVERECFTVQMLHHLQRLTVRRLGARQLSVRGRKKSPLRMQRGAGRRRRRRCRGVPTTIVNPAKALVGHAAADRRHVGLRLRAVQVSRVQRRRPRGARRARRGSPAPRRADRSKLRLQLRHCCVRLT